MRPGEKLSRVVTNCLRSQGLRPRRGDILAVASKIVSTCEHRVVKLSDVRLTASSRRLARRWSIDDPLAALVANEADEIVGGVTGFLLTIKNGILTPNAGIDIKNSPPGSATLWPVNPDRSARILRRGLERRFGTRIGVEIVDSRVTALRLGTVGLAIGLSGFCPVLDHRGVHDLFGRSIKVTQSNLADDIASAAHLLMGESAELIGGVIIRGAGIDMTSTASGGLVRLSRERCLIGGSLIQPKA